MTVPGVTAGQLTVERAMLATLEKWFSTYVTAAARRYAATPFFEVTPQEMEQMLAGYAALLADPDGDHKGFPWKPRSTSVSTDYQDWLVDALPHVQVLSPAWESAGGSQDGQTIDYQVQVAVVVGGWDQASTRLIRACYEDSVIGVVKQHQTLGGIATGVKGIGGGAAQFNEITDADSETLQGSIAVFVVTVENVIDPFSGPREPLEPDENGVPPVWPADPTLGEDGAEFTLEAEEIT